jgi:tellurite resistance protein TerC
VFAATADSFVDIDVPAWSWVALLALFAAMLTVDLVLHRGDHEPSTKRTVVESSIWISIGVAFSLVVLVAWGGPAAGEYLSGYVIEKSLSVDNVFVWAVIFSTMAIPLKYQHRVLFWGIFGALVLRAAFIFAGTALLDRFWWLLLVFGAFLVITGFKVLRHTDDEGTREESGVQRAVQKVIPVTDTLDGHKFFTVANGVRMATPLFVALIVIEFTDVIFALDSVPAVLAVSREPFIVFSSNAFAILGLRALYFLLAGAKERFHYLSHALGGILIFVGVKMTISHWWHMPTIWSLAVIFVLLVAAFIGSAWYSRTHPTAAPHVHPELRDVNDPAT